MSDESEGRRLVTCLVRTSSAILHMRSTVSLSPDGPIQHLEIEVSVISIDVATGGPRSIIYTPHAYRGHFLTCVEGEAGNISRHLSSGKYERDRQSRNPTGSELGHWTPPYTW